ncbi:DUF1553 domain-containing protein [Planctomicrobium sp. SH664]|uniref:DUF1553 domain-containing protein n=1 Tax=Planctomicrobium sp. SH664 TaxID=3448125 RepID=UPI003F5B6928
MFVMQNISSGSVRFAVLILQQGLLLLALTKGTAAAERELDFSREIKPILSNACFQCHGPDAEDRQGGTNGLRLDEREAALEDLGGYAAIRPGDPDASEIVRRMTSSDADLRMPPASSGKKVTPQETELIRKWIQQGAKYAGHWSYQPPVRPELPPVQNTEWGLNPVDAFVLLRLETEGLRPASPADREALIRRVSLDLTGLPPTLAEVEAFVADPAPDAYPQLIDRLLAKPAYGEHWARMWLDLARYADSAGYADDPARQIWLFRDYVIRSLNDNKPFDQFTIEQLAGDLLPQPTEDQLIATAFHRNTLTNNEGGTDDEEFRNVAVVDRVNTTMAVWMGTTMACAQCHTHKFDPLTQEEYFKLFAILNNTADADRKDEAPVLSVYTEAQQKQRARLQQELATVARELQSATPELQARCKEWDARFPRPLEWVTLPIDRATAQTGVPLQVEGHSVHISEPNRRDHYSVSIPLPEGTYSALRIEVQPDDSDFPGGPGNGKKNGVVPIVSATVTLPTATPLGTRTIRVQAPGKARSLALAEVEVFQKGSNLALQGQVTQSSTKAVGTPQRAIDGRPAGKSSPAKTEVMDDPWWELDLGSEQLVDRLVLRFPAGEQQRDLRVTLSNSAKQVVWQRGLPTSEGEAAFSLTTERFLPLVAGVADDVSLAAESRHPDPLQSIVFAFAQPTELPQGGTFSVELENSPRRQMPMIGRFRLSLARGEFAPPWRTTPQAVVSLLMMGAAQRTPAEQQRLLEYFLSTAPELDAARQKQARLQKQLDGIRATTVPICRELPAEQRRVTRLQRRGNFMDLGEVVSPGTPAVFPPIPAGAPNDRLGLALWLVSPENPLTARVTANRYWEQLFGIGLVSTSEEFGSQGELPSHPELLDWLATELVRLNWDTKAFLKLLVTSATYRQSSAVTEKDYERDPDNRLLARGPRFRLNAETIRDQALFVSGLLSSKMYGPPVYPPQPETGLKAAFGGSVDWQTSQGEDKFRRALYTQWKRSNPYPSMATFDSPNRDVCTIRRSRTNTPLQALVTMNDPVYIEAAQALARRIVREGGSSAQERLTYGFRLCLSRFPREQELARLLQLRADALARFLERPDAARSLATEPIGPLPEGEEMAELAAWTVVANVLLNLDEMMMKR